MARPKVPHAGKNERSNALEPQVETFERKTRRLIRRLFMDTPWSDPSPQREMNPRSCNREIEFALVHRHAIAWEEKPTFSESSSSHQDAHRSASTFRMIL